MLWSMLFNWKEEKEQKKKTFNLWTSQTWQMCQVMHILQILKSWYSRGLQSFYLSLGNTFILFKGLLDYTGTQWVKQWEAQSYLKAWRPYLFLTLPSARAVTCSPGFSLALAALWRTRRTCWRQMPPLAPRCSGNLRPVSPWSWCRLPDVICGLNGEQWEITH